MKRMDSAKTCCALLCLVVLAAAAVAACSLTVAAPAGGVVRIPLPVSDASVYLDANGTTAFSGTDILHIGQTGEPSLPCQSIRVLLPPDADLATVEARISGHKWTEIDGEWDIPPVGRFATGDGEGTLADSARGEAIADIRDASIYESNTVFPFDPVRKVDVQEMRGWKMAQVLYSPMAYNPVEKKVCRLSGDAIEITFERTTLEGNSTGVDLTSAEQVRGMTVNFTNVAGEYGSYTVSADTGRYVIITTAAIQAVSSSLMDFVASKEARGFTVQVVTEETWQNHSGNNDVGDPAAEHLRSWLKANYMSLNIKYVLLIGNPNPATGDVPMKMCYCYHTEYDQHGDPTTTTYDVPTDFYYAELTSNYWDKDGDGKYGEYKDDFDSKPPQDAEVSVGRIPYYGSITDLDHILSKIIDYENAPASGASWRKNALLPMKPSDASTPGYQLGEEIKTSVLIPNGWTYHRVYDQYNSYCTPTPCVLSIPADTETKSCTVANVTTAWNSSDFGAVFWWTHGSDNLAASVMDLTHAATLHDDHPGFTFQCSCRNGWPEDSNNLAYSLLKNGCVATAGASRDSWYQIGQASFAGTATNSGMTFEYSRRLVAEQMYAGSALNDLRLDLSPNADELWMNYLDFNLYGCPAVGPYTSTPSLAAPSVVTYYAKNVSTTSARLRANLTSLGTADNVTVSFQWGTASGVYTDNNAPQVMTTTGTFYFDASGLHPAKTYYYQAKAVGNGTSYGLEKSFTTLSTPPSVATNSADNVTTTSATLKGYLGNLGTAENVTVSFEWGLTTSYENETSPQPGIPVGVFSDNLTGLSPNTTYHFRAKAVGHGTGYGDDIAFTTQAIPPSVTTNVATNLATTSARLNGNLTSLGTATSVIVSFHWGTTPGGPYPNSTDNQTRPGAGTFYSNLGGLTPGTTYYYRAEAVGDGTSFGEGGNFTTLTTPPSVTTREVGNIDIDGAWLNGNLTSLGTATSVAVSFQWGTAPGIYGNETAAEPRTAPGGFHFDLSGVSSGTTFYYRAKAVGHGDPVYGLEKSFRTGTPPSVTTLVVSGLTFSSARLNGDLISLGGADNVTVSFVWDNTPDCAEETAPEIRLAIGTFYFELQNLIPETTYYYRVKADGLAGPVYGDLMSFTTLSVPPTVTTGFVTNLAVYSATLNGTLEGLGTAPAVNVSFEWGTQSGVYGNETTPVPLYGIGSYSANLGSLPPGTIFYYRAKAAGYGQTQFGDEMRFATLASPAVTTGDASDVTPTSARLNGSLSSLGTAASVNVSFQWGTVSGIYSNETTVEAKAGAETFYFGLTGLTPETIYYYRAKAEGDGNPVYGDEKNLTTTDGAAPVISEASASDITLSGATITWGTNEPASSRVEYGLTERYGSSTTMDASLVESHSIHLTNLKAGRVYHYRVVSKDAAGNQAVSADGTFTTASRSGEPPFWVWILVGVGVVGGIAILLAVLRSSQHGKRAT